VTLAEFDSWSSGTRRDFDLECLREEGKGETCVVVYSFLLLHVREKYET